MIFEYRKKYLMADLFFGIFYSLLGLLSLVSEYNGFLRYGFLGIGLLYLFQYYHKWKNSYLKIEDNVLTVSLFFQQKRIDLSQVTRIKKFVDEITFLTPHEKLKISTKLLARKDLPAFHNLLASLDLEPKINPFSKKIISKT